MRSGSSFTGLADVLRTYLWLGVSAFGGPSVHVQIFLRHFVEQKQWVDATVFADLWALGSALPGPASTQLGFAIAMYRHGLLLALVAFFCWALPGALGMLALAAGVSRIPAQLPTIALRLLTGLSAAAVGLIAVSATKLAKSTATDGITRALLFISAAATCCYSATWLIPVVVLSSGVVTLVWDHFEVQRRLVGVKRLLKRQPKAVEAQPTDAEVELAELRAQDDTPAVTPGLSTKAPSIASVSRLPTPPPERERSSIRSRRTVASQEQPIAAIPVRGRLQALKQPAFQLCVGLMALFIVDLAVPLGIRGATEEPSRILVLYSNLVVAGTIIFGGGPVVVPLLQSYVVEPGFVTIRQFLLGFSILQAFPGPNFNFAVYLGYLSVPHNPALGAFLGFLAIFSPGILLKAALMPYYKALKDKPLARSALRGLGSAATGLIFSAIYRLWRVGALQDDGPSISLDSDGWWPVVAAGAYLAESWIGLPPYLTIASGAVAGLLYYAVVR